MLATMASTMTNCGPFWSRLRFALAALLTACDETGSDDDDPYAVEEIAASASNEFFDGEVDLDLADGRGDTEMDRASALELELRAPGPVGCEAQADAEGCLAAGCRWLDTFGVAVDLDAGSCELGESIGLCYPQELAQPCTNSTTHCSDGDAIWALSGPDGGLWMARSTNSCGVAVGFLPCGSELLGEAATLACACACAD